MANSDLYIGGRKTPTSDALAGAMHATDETQSWQSLLGQYDPKGDTFKLSLISRGPIPRIEPDTFREIEEMVKLEDINPDAEGPLRDYGL